MRSRSVHLSRRRARAVPSTALALATIATGATSAFGQGLERDWISPSTGTTTQRFGNGMAAQDDVLIGGAPNDDTKAANAGSVHVYRFDASTATWSLEQQLFAKDAEAGALFGAAVAIDGDVLIVGAPMEDNAKGTDAGAVYVFRYDASTSTWSEEQKLLASVGSASDAFGAAVAVSGDGFVVGAPTSDTPAGADGGSAYVYRYKNSIVKWAEETRLIDPDGGKGDQAGFSVDLAGAIAVVSSHLADDNALKDSGTVGIWELGGGVWTQTAELVQGTPTTDAFFGSAVAIDGDVLAVGASAEDASSAITDSGAAYFFRRSAGAWSQEARFPAPGPSKSGAFGNSIDVLGDLVIVGSNLDDSSGKSDSGTTWTYRHGKKGWFLDQQLGASDTATNDKLGTRVALTASHIFGSADMNDTALGTDVGAIYVYPRAEITTDVTPTSPAAGATITFSSFYGSPGDPVLLTIEDIDGTPMFLPVIAFVFAADRTFTFDAPAPDPLYGISVGLRSYKVSETGPLVFSELAFVDL